MKYKTIEPWKYELLTDEHVVIKLGDDCEFNHVYFSCIKVVGEGMYSLLIHKSYAWNGSNDPAIDTITSMKASLVHDVLCQAINEKLLSSKHRKACDRVYYEICKSEGMNPFRAWYQYKTMRKGIALYNKLKIATYGKVYEI